jgi:hypothetical protein
MNGHFKKIEWKGIVKRSINTYWNTKLQLDCQSKSSAISLIETFSLITIWWSRLSCLLCSSADIGNVPNNRYTAEFAVLIGGDCRRFSVPIWKLERVAITFFFRFSVSRPYSNLGIT